MVLIFFFIITTSPRLLPYTGELRMVLSMRHINRCMTKSYYRTYNIDIMYMHNIIVQGGQASFCSISQALKWEIALAHLVPTVLLNFTRARQTWTKLENGLNVFAHGDTHTPRPASPLTTC